MQEQKVPLSELDNKSDKLSILVLQLYRMQKFSPKALLSKCNKVGFKDNTIKIYFKALTVYLDSGKKYTNIPSRLFDLVDKYVAKKESIWTPAEADKRKIHKHQSKVVKLAIQPKLADTTLEQYDKAANGHFKNCSFGILENNGIRFFNNKDQALGYQLALKELKKKVTIVKVEYELI